ncbi:MAG: 4Fe-4S single cluster domain-containing protein, partial [Nannocystaceae bacterium]
VQGCPLACPGCCNPEMWAGDGGSVWALDRLMASIVAARENHGIEGVTLLGGEPFVQAIAVAKLARELQTIGLGVVVFSGYTRAEIEVSPEGPPVLACIDTLVDGRYDRALPEPPRGRRYLGSTNQTLHHLSSRYASGELWRGPNHVEVQVGPDGSVSVHGYPELGRRLLRQLHGRG